MEQGANRVFLNPNFQRPQTNNIPSKSMHINPNFPQYNMSTIRSNSVNNTRIYVNPNFVRSNFTGINNLHSLDTPNLAAISNNKLQNTQVVHCSNPITPFQNSQLLSHSEGTHTFPSTSNSRYSLVRGNINKQKNQSSDKVTTNFKVDKYKSEGTHTFPSTSKSRYSLVRSNINKQIKENQPLEKVTTTFKVNKYKSVSIQHLKDNLLKDKTPQKMSFKLIRKQTCTNSMKTKIDTNVFSSQYKLVKQKPQVTSPTLKLGPKSKRLSTSLIKGIVRSNIKTKINKTHFKKNNIPCPLFRKFGKCLRNTQGKCEFLHDKKHVSICRKFLKGICHDKECLFSHNVSKKKMPTCYFYLKGMCTKEDCPYLHVKLSEKSKICIDFLKGYCEKGDECLNRHINICPQIATRGVCFKKHCPYPHKSNVKLVKGSRMKVKIKDPKNYKTEINLKGPSKTDNTGTENNLVECRYYKDVNTGESQSCEVIKPSRCKLGTLPSFIKL